VGTGVVPRMGTDWNFEFAFPLALDPLDPQSVTKAEEKRRNDQPMFLILFYFANLLCHNDKLWCPGSLSSRERDFSYPAGHSRTD